MQAILIWLFRLFKGLSFAAPFLLSAGSALLVGGASLYGLVSWIYDYVDDNFSDISNFLDTVLKSVDSLAAYISGDVTGTIPQNLCYMLAVDSLLKDISTFSVIVISGLVFIFSGVVILFIAVIFKMISSSIISKVSKLLSNSTMVSS